MIINVIVGFDPSPSWDVFCFFFHGHILQLKRRNPWNLQDSSASLSPAQEEQTTSGNFIFKAALAAAALCLGGAGASVTASSGCDPFSGQVIDSLNSTDLYRLIQIDRKSQILI